MRKFDDTDLLLSSVLCTAALVAAMLPNTAHVFRHALAGCLWLLGRL